MKRYRLLRGAHVENGVKYKVGDEFVSDRQYNEPARYQRVEDEMNSSNRLMRLKAGITTKQLRDATNNHNDLSASAVYRESDLRNRYGTHVETYFDAVGTEWVDNIKQNTFEEFRDNCEKLLKWLDSHKDNLPHKGKVVDVIDLKSTDLPTDLPHVYLLSHISQTVKSLDEFAISNGFTKSSLKTVADVRGCLSNWIEWASAKQPAAVPTKQLLGAKNGELDIDVAECDVPAEFRDKGKSNGMILTTTYLTNKDNSDWNITFYSSKVLTVNWKSGKLTRRIKVGRTYAYLYVELLTISSETQRMRN